MTQSLHRTRTHVTEVPGCFGCRIAGVAFTLPASFRAVEKYRKPPKATA